MDEALLEGILTYFNGQLSGDTLKMTLINPNITAEVMTNIKNHMLISHLRIIEVVIIDCPNFDDNLLTIFAQGLPHSLTDFSVDFTGCENLRGDGFLELFQKLDGLQLTKLSLDLGSLYDLNDIVMEGLAMLLNSHSQTLEEFYLDLYEVDQITEEGYMVLADAVSELEKLTKLHIDLSANYNLSQDSLEVLFAGKYQNLKHFTFKVLDIEQIGGGSFFKLAQALQQMIALEQLTLTISTFSNLNQKGVYSTIRSISKLNNLRLLNLNLSDIDIPERILTYLAFSPKLEELALDVSCNRRITFGDFLNLGTKLKGLRKIDLNVDFCTNITEDVIEEVVMMISQENKCVYLTLSDRDYSIQFQNSVVDHLMNLRSLIELNLSTKNISKKLKVFEAFLKKKKHFLCIAQHAGGLARAVMWQIFAQ